MTKKMLILMFVLFIVFFSSGCVKSVKDCTSLEYEAFFPILDSPADGATVSYDGTLQFDWHDEESCIPENYILHVYEPARDYDWDMLIDGSETQFSYDFGFLPGQEYQWSISTREKFMGSKGSHMYIYGPDSQTHTFYTDGICSPSELEAPTLKDPDDGEWVTSYGYPPVVFFSWHHPDDCFPETYHYQIAADPEFNNIITSGTTELLESYVLVQVPECVRFYWRVQARTGSSSSSYSDIRRLTYASDFGCWQNQESIDAALIRGFVFEDYCMATFPYVPEDVGISMECAFSEKFGVYGNGVRARGINGEPGIPNVVIDLGAGSCPSIGLDEFTTQQNGMYYFMVQSPGEYCVSVSKIKNPDLENGIWTYPLTDQDVTQQTLTFGSGEMKKSQNFGWDEYDYIPVEFGVYLQSVCRAGDSKDYREVMYLEKDQIVPIIARNEAATWFLTKFGCYISLATGEPLEDPSILEIYPDVPPPQIPEADDPNVLKSCSSFDDRGLCPTPRCTWVVAAGAPDFCTDN